MALFDDPKKELRRLEAELLAEGDAEFYDDTMERVDELLEEYEEDYVEELEDTDILRRSDKNRDYRIVMSETLLEEEADSDRAYYREDYRRAKRKKKRKTGCLLAVLALDAAIILLVLGWWYGWIG